MKRMKHPSWEEEGIMYVLVAYERGDEGMAGLILKPEELGARSIMIEDGKETGVDLLIEVKYVNNCIIYW